MLNEERQRAILDLLRRDGRVLVVDLARHFHTSQVTIRKDLETLHVKGSIHRTHGGGLPARDGALEDPNLREKEKLHRQEKLRIAAAAVRMVTEGQVVVLDSGTTTTAIARALRNRRRQVPAQARQSGLATPRQATGQPGQGRGRQHRAGLDSVLRGNRTNRFAFFDNVNARVRRGRGSGNGTSNPMHF